MKSSLVLVLLSIIVVWCDQLSTFRGPILQQSRTRQIVCISDNTIDAITWNTPLQWMNTYLKAKQKNDVTEPVLSSNGRNAIDCKFSSESDPCFSRWSQQPASAWQIRSSWNEPMGPVFDRRWEVLKEYQNPGKLMEIAQIATTGSMVVSIRGRLPVHFFLCRCVHHALSICYGITLRGGKYADVWVQRCFSNLNDEGAPQTIGGCVNFKPNYSRKIELNDLEWKTFVIKWDEESSSIQVYDLYELVSSHVYDRTPNVSDNRQRMYRVYFGSAYDEIPKRYRFHAYNYTLATEPDARLSARFTSTNAKGDFCMDLLVGLCAKCDLEISVWDADRNRWQREFIPGNATSDKAHHGLPLWQHIKVEFSNIRTQSKPTDIIIATKLSNSDKNIRNHWAIANVQECSPEGIINNREVPSTSDSVTIIKCSSWLNLNLSTEPFGYPSSAELCRNSHFGPLCAVSCSGYFTSDCKSVTMCDKDGCYCAQGFTGKDCGNYCEEGFYGYGCQERCGRCAQLSSYSGWSYCDKFTGRCDECETSPSRYPIPPYCKDDTAISNPTAPNITYVTETSGRLDLPVLPDYANVNASFVFELEDEDGLYLRLPSRESQHGDSNIPTSLTATFTDLTPGTQYKARMLMTIGNGLHNLTGDWGSFITGCYSSANYSVTPDETTLTISKCPTTAMNSCPDSWYLVTFSPVPPKWKGAPNKWPVILTDLSPYQPFRVEVIGLDGIVQFEKSVRTLEAAPSKVRDLQIEYETSSSAELTWNTPDEPNGKLQGYEINIKLGYYKGCRDRNHPQPSNIDQYPIITTTVVAHIHHYTITDLKPYVGYYVYVLAYHSKRGVENGITIETKKLDVPTEQFVNLHFLEKTSTITWDHPDCSTISGPISGTGLVLTGVSPAVETFSYMQITDDSEFRLDIISSNQIYGLEMYRVKLYVLRYKDGRDYNRALCSSLEFLTPPSAPPKVQNLEIVEVDSENEVITLRWQKPLPPLNGNISHYFIFFVEEGRRKGFKVGTNNACSYWLHKRKDLLCKTVKNVISSSHIEVVAYNDNVEEPGAVVSIRNRVIEEGADPPELVKLHYFKYGVVQLEWSHPWRTGGPLTQFTIKYEITTTNLSEFASRKEQASLIRYPVTKSAYHANYSQRIDLLSSTDYRIQIEAVGRFPGKATEFNISISSSFAFDAVQPPVVNAAESQIKIVIPSIINDTKTNIMDVIVIGPPRCNNIVEISQTLANDLDLDSYADAWCVASFLSSNKANTSFTIGDGGHYDNRDNNTNCLVFDGCYRIALLVRDSDSNSRTDDNLLIWTSDSITIDSKIPDSSHLIWIVPLVLIVVIACGVAWLYLRYRKEILAEVAGDAYDDTLPLPLLRTQNLVQIPLKRASHIAISQESVEEIGNEVRCPKVDYEKGRCSPVKLKEFQDYVKNGIASGKLAREYDAFPRGQTKSWEYAKLPQNKMKNRYANLLAYDETRVVLEMLPNEPLSDYINANYIQGYKKNRAYIATQGPTANTVRDFWRMIWQEKVEVICMLANVMEGEKKKCEQYWPEIGNKCEFGSITVDHIFHTAFADYIFRTFNVTRNGEVRKVEHLHYTAWPDHGVPLYTQSIVAYLKKILATPAGHGPIVIHCSAGVGRTGTIILCDMCLRRAAAEGMVDVFVETKAIRSQRANMVDNKEQYILAHLALVECLLALPTMVPCNKRLSTKVQEYKQQVSLHLQRLNESAWQDEALQPSAIKSVEMSKANIPKNRYPELAAVVGGKIHISRYPKSDDDSDYMYGVYVDSARCRNNYIASQLPLPTTVNDFWRMIAEFRIELVIALQPPDQDDPTCCQFVTEIADADSTSPLTWKVIDSIEEEICTRQKLVLTDSSEDTMREQPVTVLLLKGWESGERKPPPKPITLVDFWQYAQRIARSEAPTVVLCHDGVTNCGLYLALSFLLERMGLERECDVYLAIRAIRRSRPDFCKTPEQWEYLYDAAITYADYFETYANFT